MCGIAGYIGKTEQDRARINATLEKMRNRGPDNRDCQVFKFQKTHIALLHSRLSIIDLDERSNQPFSIGNYTVIFNGEIYNYLELKERLDDGLMTESDTEVLLRYYIKYGEKCVDYFEGMWAFAIYDANKGTLFLSRDRFGEKPFYLMDTADGFYFGSEIKFLKALSGENPNINYRHLKRYLVNGYKSLYKTEDTFYEGIRLLPYASSITVDSNLSKRQSRYWKPVCVPRKMSMQEAVEGTRERFINSMKLRLRSDVPMAFCLSGGIDSNAIVSTAVKKFNYDVATFTIIDSDERYNEEENVDATIADLGCKNTKIRISHENTLQRLQKLIEYHDMPISTITYLIHSMLSEEISSQGYRVVASGTAADELFTGYYDHHNFHLHDMRNHPDFGKYLDNWKNNTGKVVRNPYLKNPNIFIENPEFREHIYLNNDIFASYLTEDFEESFEENDFGCDSVLRNRMLNELFHEATPVILQEDDLNSMFYSIENRSPFLDKSLFEFAFSIPTEHLIHDGCAKHVLREAMNGIINDKVRLDRQKRGFNASLNSLVDFEDPETKDLLLSDSPVFDLIKREKIEEAVKQNPLPNSFSKFVFNFINIKMFLEMNN